eukprot:340647_1
MALALHQEWQYFLLAISWLVSLLSFIICTYGTYKVVQRCKQINQMPTKTNQPKTLTLLTLTIVSMWIFTACNICDSIGFPYWSELVTGSNAYNHNLNSYMMWNVFWCVGKIAQYILYCGRLWSVFRGTKYDSGPNMYIIIFVLLIVQCITLCVWVYYYNIGWICCEFWPEDIFESLTAIAWIILVLDIIITTIIIVLFLWSMKKLLFTVSKHMNSSGSSDIKHNGTNVQTTNVAVSGSNISKETSTDVNDDKKIRDRQKMLQETTTRLFVLAMIGLLSSIFYQMVFGIAMTEEFYGKDLHTVLYYFSFTWGLDNLTNVICLCLSFSFMKPYYYKVCCCDKCCLNMLQKITATKSIVSGL